MHLGDDDKPEKIDVAILKLSFQINVILSFALRTNFEQLGRQFVCHSPNNTSDLICIVQTIKLLVLYKLCEKAGTPTLVTAQVFKIPFALFIVWHAL